MLQLSDVQVCYQRAVLALHGLSLLVPEGHIVALLGNNGAGKSTALKAISGLLAAEQGRVVGGDIQLDGQSVVHLDPAERVRRGVFHVLEGRRIFAHLNVEENLMAGAHTRTGRGIREDIHQVYRYFPRLRERRQLLAGYLSGGEQQMLAIGRAVMARPRLILLDEPSLGLAPLVVKDIFEIIQHINRTWSTTILLVEQNARLAMQVANYVYVLESGSAVLEGDPRSVVFGGSIEDVYLGNQRVAA
jgi:branched-chain amino acid transport system ATP-binding protein